MGPLALIIPAIMWTFEHIVGPITNEVTKTGILGELESLAVNSGLGKNILSIFQQHMSDASEAQKQEFQLKLNSMLGQIQLDTVEAQSEHFFDRGWRPFLAWGLSINVILHLSILSLANILRMVGYNIPTLTPMDSITLALLTSLLGIYMGARTVEKTKGVN
jgi:hypothetical protein